MNGVMHVGLKQEKGGRVGDKASVGLSDQLRDLGFEVKRLKTGTPARLWKGSIDWSKTTAQYGDEHFFPFSFRTKTQTPELPQVACFLSRTTEETHEIIRKSLHLSPMYCGVIEGQGPRYCPSIEDKVVRFADKDSHQTFLEPESLRTELIYLQGISTSLPEAVQMEFLKTIPGLESVDVAQFGYAVEYDFVEPRQIKHSLETRLVEGLFLAGQINGTSGYEEAGAQGLIAGINAAHFVLNRPEFILGRNEAYMGVLIDDLVTKGTREPYRMFTSRAEHRLILREDNTVDRMGPIGVKLGLISEEYLADLEKTMDRRVQLVNFLETSMINPTEIVQKKLLDLGTTSLNKPSRLADLLRRPEMTLSNLSHLVENLDLDPLVSEAVEIQIKYHGYISKQAELIEQVKKLEGMQIPEDFDFQTLKGLSSEEVLKLSQIRPRTIGQAQRISGVNPSAIQAIMIYLKSKKDSGDYSIERHKRN
jgi:tRNA uridine 5-carboxymethylaminomethyl modification enzyme